MAHEGLSDASVVGQSDMALMAVVVGVAAAVVLADVGRSDVGAGVTTVVGCRQRSFGLVSPLADGPVRVAVESSIFKSAVLLLF